MSSEEIDEEKVLEIVQQWDIKEEPEYREFRCASCSKVLRKAWHVWLNQGGYKLEVHFCNDCYRKLTKEN